MDQTERIIYLLTRRLSSPLTEDEIKELEAWMSENPEVREALSQRLSDPSLLGEYWRKRSLVDTGRPLADMQERLGLSSRNRRFGYAALGAAVSAAAVVALIWLPLSRDKDMVPASVVKQQSLSVISLDSIRPGETLAYLDNGEDKIPVESSSRGLPVAALKKQGNIKNGPIVLEVPRGGEFIVVLEDSTKVWLNSASTLTYPENFSSGARRVEVSGEAYFSVTKQPEGSPFYVTTAGQEVCVYGTEFNIRSYPEEKSVFTSLRSGAVGLRRLDGAGGELKLSPGNQAVFNKESMRAEVRNVDIEIVTGWRNGRFVFHEQTLRQIMYDLGRWYDFDFEFAEPELEEMVFMGSIPRYSDFSTAMMILEKIGGISFSVNDGKILIKRK